MNKMGKREIGQQQKNLKFMNCGTNLKKNQIMFLNSSDIQKFNMMHLKKIIKNLEH